MAERVGGHPVLVFVNTLYSWTEPDAPDELASFAAALEVAVAAGIATRGEARALAGDSRRELERLRALRRLLHDVFAAHAPRPADLDALAEAWAAAARHARLQATGRGRVELGFPPDGPEVIRHRLIQSAIDLLRSPDRARVGACPACGWLFLDTSKNRSRRWCSMKTCGSAAKAATYYRRRVAPVIRVGSPRGRSRARKGPSRRPPGARR